ncbi:unnamed protein product [Caenorhabditis auriculariae]|uniref:Uncharacterized protein n=1 Tax=Caenorhabditis auriculariae TaxID=2777116 RepID=A0A8S1H4M1_9PELO|nr:unnamed protein product [Caenorhabditis auriculariae]
MAALFGFGQSAEIAISLDNAENRKVLKTRGDEVNAETCYLFYDGETISGTVNVTLKKANQKLEHQGIRIEFIGQIEVYYDRGNQQDFISLVKDLARPGELTQNVAFRFEFNNVEKPYETYLGTNVKLRYFLRVTIVRRLTDITREMDLLVHALSSYPDADNNIKMEVGIEDCLHIEFEYNKNRYHLRDVIVGKIYFLLVRIKIKYMEIAILKMEVVGSGPNTFKESETVAKFEIMDGAPVRGESIPIRLFLGGYDLAPTMRDVGKKFSDRRYFKQQEVTLWRRAEKPVRRALDAGDVEEKPEVQNPGTQKYVSATPHPIPAEEDVEPTKETSTVVNEKSRSSTPSSNDSY